MDRFEPGRFQMLALAVSIYDTCLGKPPTRQTNQKASSVIDVAKTKRPS
jgi:hypothetical protein